MSENALLSEATNEQLLLELSRRLRPEMSFTSELLLQKVDELGLSIRATNCLNNANIVYIGDLIQKTTKNLLQIPYFGRRCLMEVNALLTTMGLTLKDKTP